MNVDKRLGVGTKSSSPLPAPCTLSTHCLSIHHPHMVLQTNSSPKQKTLDISEICLDFCHRSGALVTHVENGLLSKLVVVASTLQFYSPPPQSSQTWALALNVFSFRLNL